jgi:AraC-like DNA-binding protein
VFCGIDSYGESMSQNSSSYIDSLRQQLETLPLDQSHDTRSKLFKEYIRTNDISEASKFVKACLLQSEEADDRMAVAQYQIFSSVAQRYSMNYDSAYHLLFTCLQNIHELENKDSILCQVYNLFGVYLTDKGQKADSYLYFKKAAMICEESQTESSFLVHVYSNLAVMSLSTGNYEEGLEYCRKAYALSREVDTEIRFTINNNRALLLVGLGQCDSAVYYYSKVLKAVEKGVEIGPSIFALADYLKSSMACPDLNQTKAISVQLTDVLERSEGLVIAQSYGYLCLGNYMEHMGRNDLAIDYYQKAHTLAEESRIWNRKSDALHSLGLFYSKNEEKDSAIKYLLLYKSSIDSGLVNSDRRDLSETERELTLWNINREKNEISAKVKHERLETRYFQLISAALLIIALLAVLSYIRKRQQNKALFERALLLSEKNSSLSEDLEGKKSEHEDIELTAETSDKIRHGLFRHLVSEQMFLNNQCNAAMLSNAIGTNRTYLNQYVKEQFGTTVSEYINDLRLFYVLELLKVDSRMRKYTIDRIASNSGFNTKRTFERAFKARTGITPAFFIRELEAKSS